MLFFDPSVPHALFHKLPAQFKLAGRHRLQPNQCNVSQYICEPCSRVCHDSRRDSPAPEDRPPQAQIEGEARVNFAGKERRATEKARSLSQEARGSEELTRKTNVG